MIPKKKNSKKNMETKMIIKKQRERKDKKIKKKKQNIQKLKRGE